MSPNPSSRRLAVLAAAIAFAAIGTGSASAETGWQATHPRRTEVNGRLANQDRRIHNEVADGDISHREAARLHAEDNGIRDEERAMAERDGGHITPGEQRVLNHQENRVSGQIGE